MPSRPTNPHLISCRRLDEHDDDDQIMLAHLREFMQRFTWLTPLEYKVYKIAVCVVRNGNIYIPNIDDVVYFRNYFWPRCVCVHRMQGAQLPLEVFSLVVLHTTWKRQRACSNSIYTKLELGRNLWIYTPRETVRAWSLRFFGSFSNKCRQSWNPGWGQPEPSKRECNYMRFHLGSHGGFSFQKLQAQRVCQAENKRFTQEKGSQKVPMPSMLHGK